MTEVTAVEDRFILHWGEMGARWGINRTVAQIHALLYLSPRPLSAEEICERLSVARSSVSTGLRELKSWGLVNTVHRIGERRDHFETLTDVWEMFRLVLQGRKRREIDPTLAMLTESVDQLRTNQEDGGYTRERLEEMLDFFEVATAGYEKFEALPIGVIRRLAKSGEGLRNLLKGAAD